MPLNGLLPRINADMAPEATPDNYEPPSLPIVRHGRRFAVGDVHGCYYTLRELVETTLGLTEDDQLILLGDYVNKGPHGRQVLDYILRLRRDGYQAYALRGNHEEMFRYYGREFPELFPAYLRDNHGHAFLLPDTNIDVYLRFAENLPYVYQTADHYLVHAGFSFRSESPFRDTHRMLWTRAPEYNADYLNNKTVVHGHTPQSMRRIREAAESGHKLVGIDNGCFYKGKKGAEFGHLVALDLNNHKVYAQRNIESRFATAAVSGAKIQA